MADRGLVLIVLGVLIAGGAGFMAFARAPERHPPDRWASIPGPLVTLPEVEAANPFPSAASVSVVVLSPTEGAWVDGVRQERLEGVRDALLARVGPKPAGDADDRHVVICADERVGWGAVIWIVLMAADFKVQVRHIHFAVRHRASGERGVITMDLPVDRGLKAPPSLEDATPVVAVSAFAFLQPRESVESSSIAALEERVARAVSLAPELVLLFETPAPFGPRIPCGVALRALDAMQRGTKRVALGGAALPVPKGEYLLSELIRERSGPVAGPIVFKFRPDIRRTRLEDLPPDAIETIGSKDPDRKPNAGPPPSKVPPDALRVLEVPDLPPINDD